MAYTHDPDDITVEMTSDTTPAPNVTSASSVYATYLAWTCFDHVPSPLPNSSIWLTFSLPTPEAPQWLKFDFGGSNLYVVNKYKMTNIGAAAGVGNNDNPRDWLFQGSNDNTNWDTLDSQADITWVIDETKEFSFSNLTGYRYYRVYITDYNPAGYNYLAIAELELFGIPIAYPADRLVQYRRTRRPGLVAGV